MKTTKKNKKKGFTRRFAEKDGMLIPYEEYVKRIKEDRA